jgi:FixJ family two-component response regulator
MTDEPAVVFVVDDDPFVREALKRLLRANGLQVQTFPSAQEFLATSRPDSPCCLVLDVRMPGRSGIDLQRELAADHIRMPIIFMTGREDIPMPAGAMTCGVIKLLRKPFRDQELLDAIQEALA